MEFKINERFYLTTESPASHYGISVVADDQGNAYGPSDIVPLLPENTELKEMLGMFADPYTFDRLVYAWATEITLNGDLDQVTGMPRTKEEVIAASKFLAQWPEGDQIVPEKIFEKWQWQINHQA